MLRRLHIDNLVLIREADLAFAPGLNAVTGETGAGKTILAQGNGLLLGARADASSVGADGPEAYVEAELDVPDGFFEDDELAALAELRPEGDDGLAWRELGAAHRRYEELTRDADAVAARLAELEALVEGTDGLAPGAEEELKVQR